MSLSSLTSAFIFRSDLLCSYNHTCFFVYWIHNGGADKRFCLWYDFLYRVKFRYISIIILGIRWWKITLNVWCMTEVKKKYFKDSCSVHNSLCNILFKFHHRFRHLGLLIINLVKLHCIFISKANTKIRVEFKYVVYLKSFFFLRNHIDRNF